ncbi:MAG: spore coat associated protein CotJA [Faecalimonas sp.]|nr:spore coat associated protein CotJA [Faecalimonas sp.]
MMQNYRNNATAYNPYRQTMHNSVDTLRRDTLEDLPIAMAYVPWQKWCNIYDAEKGFCQGTIFQDLNLPFRGVGGCQQ